MMATIALFDRFRDFHCLLPHLFPFVFTIYSAIHTAHSLRALSTLTILSDRASEKKKFRETLLVP